jgi:hypothetical protein
VGRSVVLGFGWYCAAVIFFSRGGTFGILFLAAEKKYGLGSWSQEHAVLLLYRNKNLVSSSEEYGLALCLKNSMQFIQIDGFINSRLETAQNW